MICWSSQLPYTILPLLHLRYSLPCISPSHDFFRRSHKPFLFIKEFFNSLSKTQLIDQLCVQGSVRFAVLLSYIPWVFQHPNVVSKLLKKEQFCPNGRSVLTMEQKIQVSKALCHLGISHDQLLMEWLQSR